MDKKLLKIPRGESTVEWQQRAFASYARFWLFLRRDIPEITAKELKLLEEELVQLRKAPNRRRRRLAPSLIAAGMLLPPFARTEHLAWWSTSLEELQGVPTRERRALSRGLLRAAPGQAASLWKVWFRCLLLREVSEVDFSLQRPDGSEMFSARLPTTVALKWKFAAPPEAALWQMDMHDRKQLSQTRSGQSMTLVEIIKGAFVR